MQRKRADMSLDWIKMRCNLWDDPRVGGLVEETDTCEATVIGGLYWLWATADQHTNNGVMPNVSLKHIDRKTGIAGFGDALVAIGWVVVCDGGGISLSRFDEHNGVSGKQRSMTAKRVAEHRKNKGLQTCNAATVTGALSNAYLEQEEEEEEEERSRSKEKATERNATLFAHDDAPKDELPKDIAKPESPLPSESKGDQQAPKRINGTGKKHGAEHFPKFWDAYPVKKGKADALKKWKLKGCDAMSDQIVAHVRRMESQDDDWLRGFIPHGSTYINGERWEDEPKKDKVATAPASPPESFGAKAALAKSESKLENTLAWIRQQRSIGAYGEGDAADTEMRRLMAEATEKYRGQ